MLPDRQSWKFRVVLWCAYIVARGISSTWRIRVFGMENRRKAESVHPKRAFVLASFHEFAMAGVMSHPGQGISCLTSRSKDGEMVAFILERIGLRPVRGSSSRGGKEARDELLELMNAGVSCAITVDGPKGPRRKIKAGSIDMARKSGGAILPLTSIADRKWVLHKTWDQTQIPKPFSRVLLYYGEPHLIPTGINGEDFEAKRHQVEQCLVQDADLVPSRFEELWATAK